MNQTIQANSTENETTDFPTMITVICHLMTLYAMRPCGQLASNINQHIKVLLDSSATDSLGEWKSTFQQLQNRWEVIAECHAQHRLKTTTDKAHHIVSH